VEERTRPSGRQRRRWSGWLRLATVELAPLRRHRDFRLLSMGQMVSFTGSMITYVAIPFQVYQLTRSSLAVGLLGMAELAPLLATGLLGGALADAHDRRRMVQLTELGLAVLSAVLVVNALAEHPRVWVLFVVASLAAALDGLQRPSLEALLPRLVPREEMTAAAALASLRMSLGMVGGPALGGLLLASFGLAATYAIATRYGGAGVLGLLYAAPSIGSLVTNATSGWTGRVRRHGRAILVAAGLWGAAIAAFGPAAFGVRASVLSGGLLSLVGVVVVALAMPLFRTYDARRVQQRAPV
jgi:MFS family permease